MQHWGKAHHLIFSKILVHTASIELPLLLFSNVPSATVAISFLSYKCKQPFANRAQSGSDGIDFCVTELQEFRVH